MTCHTSRSSQGLSVSSCWSFCESIPRRSAMGSIDLRSPGSSSPSTYSAAPARRSLRPIGRTKGARKPGNPWAWSRQFASVHFMTWKTTAGPQECQYILNIVILGACLSRRRCNALPILVGKAVLVPLRVETEVLKHLQVLLYRLIGSREVIADHQRAGARAEDQALQIPQVHGSPCGNHDFLLRQDKPKTSNRLQNLQ